MQRKAYTENTITLDARLLQDIISGRWTRQQLYEPTPTWYHDSFYNVTSPWESRPGEYEAPFGNQKSTLTYGYQSRLLPIGPPSDVTSTTEPPSAVGPSASISETTIPQKKVDFSISRYAEETTRDSCQRETKDMPATQIEDRPITVPRSTTAVVSTVDSSPQRETLAYDEGGQTHDITTLKVRDMDITTPDCDIYHGVYTDFQLPLPNRPHISDLFVGNTCLISNTNSPTSILRIPCLKKMYGTVEFAIDQTTGQLYTVGDIDVTPINIFGGIPDENLNGKTTESTWIPPKIPQAMSIPITEVPRSTLPISITQDSVPLRTPKLPIIHREERGTSTSSSTHSNPPTTSPLFNINRVNVGAASSVSSLEEGKGIINDDEYERAVHRIEKINKKITILVRNWNEESKSAKTPTEFIEIDEFYRPYMDQYNARRKTLERLMDLYVEYYKDVTPEETPLHKYSTEQVMPQPGPVTGRTFVKEKIERVTTDKRVQSFQESLSDETRLKQEIEGKVPTSTSSGEQIMTTMSTITSAITQPLTSSDSFPRTTTETVGSMRIPCQGRLSTLSSVVRPIPTTPTRTVVITREESRQDAIETARQLIGSASPTTFLHMPTTTSASREPCPNGDDRISQSKTEMRTRPTSPP